VGSISELATAFPGETSERPHSKAPLAEILKLNGYNTAMFGKSHEFSPWETGLTGPYDQWPTGSRFERFYGTLTGEADLFAPPLHDNTTLVDLPKDPNYYYQTDLADHAIAWIRTQKSLFTTRHRARTPRVRCRARGATGTRRQKTLGIVPRTPS
jgi:arylsulfatase A-like enzyme